MTNTKKMRWVLMGLTLMVIWFGATAFNTLIKPNLEPQKEYN